MEDQLREVVSFLTDPKSEVRQMAVQICCSYSSNPDAAVYLRKSKLAALKALKGMVIDEVQIAHDALKSLINLSTDIEACEGLVDEEFVSILVKLLLVK